VNKCISKYVTPIYEKFDFGVIVKRDSQLLKTDYDVFYISA